MRESFSFRVAAEGDFENIFVPRRKCTLWMALGDGLGATMLSAGENQSNEMCADIISNRIFLYFEKSVLG